MLFRSALGRPLDGIDLTPLLTEDLAERDQPIGFRHTGRVALIDNNFKIVRPDRESAAYEVYDLANDPGESTDIAGSQPELATRLQEAVEQWNDAVAASAAGADYPTGDFDPAESQPSWWMEAAGYAPYLEEWRARPEYARYIDRVSP